MKRAILVVLECVLYYVVYAAACILRAFHKLPDWTVRMSSGRLFVLDGLVFMTALFLVLLLIKVARKKVQVGWSTPVLSYVLTLLLLLAMRFPLAWVTPSGY